jgi:methenyltetrahydromethanopterin cyclohydrolase
MLSCAEDLGITIDRRSTGSVVADCGVTAPGGMQAGIGLAEVCLAGLGQVQLATGDPQLWSGPSVQVQTDQPLAACMAAQYAGWRIATDDYFAMGSGPMRAAYAGEKLFAELGLDESPGRVVGVLESGSLPPDAVCTRIADQCGVAAEDLTLLVAATASMAGTIQVVARSIETCLHKLHELQFDLSCIRCGFGTAPLPPVAADDLAGIGRTNDAILYGGQVTLWLYCEDATLLEIGPRVPSGASSDHGVPFWEIFQRYDRQFYRIDPMLFSPAVVTFNNLKTGRSFCYGCLAPEVIRSSFASQ